MKASWKSCSLRYGCAVVSVAAAIGVRRLLDPWVGQSFPFATVFFAILLTTWLGGFKPALTAVGLGGIAADYFLLAPRGSLKVEGPELMGLLLYLLTGIGIAALGGMMDRTRRLAETNAAALRASNEHLEARVQERTAELHRRTETLESEIAARRLGEAQLQLLEVCVNRLNDVVLITEAESGGEAGPRIVYVNDAFVRRTGYTREETLGKSLGALQGPKTGHLELDHIREALRWRKPERVELINRTKTGEEYWLDIDIMPVSDATGRLTHWVAVERDITDRKLAEERMARLAAIVQSSDDAIIGKNLEGIVTSWNVGAEKIFGYLADEMVGQPVLRLIPPERHHEELEILSCVRRGESVRHFDTVRLRKDGGLVDVSITTSAIKDATGKIIGASKIARDISERKRAEQVTQQSEAEFRTLAEAMPQMVWATRADGTNIYFSQRWMDYTGLSLAESLGDGWNKPFHPDDRQRAWDAWQQAVSGTSEYSLECRLRRADGVYRWWWILGAPLRAADGSILKWFGTCTDVTERRKAEEARRASERLLQTVMDLVPHFIFAKDSQGRYILVNRACAAANGLAPEKMIGRTDLEFVKDRTQAEAFMQADRELMASGQPKFIPEEQLTSALGNTRILQTTKIPFSMPGFDGPALVGVSVDITDIKRMESDLKESEERFRTMANSMSQLAWIAQADGYIFWYNQRWYEYTGTTPEQMEGWGWQAVHDPVMLPLVMERWKNAIASGQMFDMEFPLRGANGKFRNFLTRGRPFKDSSGRVVQWFGTNTDVDELKQAEEEIRLLNAGLEQRVAARTAQLEAANKELESFSYSVSHDLRAPLRAVNGFAKIVLDDFGPQLPAAAREYLEWIRNGGQQMGQLIDDLLSFSRLGRQAVKRHSVDTARLVQAVLKELAPEGERRPIEFNVGTLPGCYGDSALLKQVWVNLIANAIKYTRGRTPAVIDIRGDPINSETVYQVADNGTGFDMRYAHKLFGVFQRLHRADEFEGTGVGLAIVQRIVHRHGGRVWAEAEVGRGATFRFTLGSEVGDSVPS